MSYVDQSGKRNPVTVAAVVGVHVAIGYALLSGLAYQVIKRPPPITTVEFPVDQPPPPPPHPIQRPRSDQHRSTIQPPVAPRLDALPLEPRIVPLPPTGEILSGGSGSGTTLPQLRPPQPSQARDAIPAADRLRWITTEDYPATALRQGLQGIVVVSAMIGADGRVRSCIVTQSSGSQLLDDTTCRLYAKRARFTPARDTDGNPTTGQRTDRFRWQIPGE